jgi:thiol-disulfide isomerase/thioredoxin
MRLFRPIVIILVFASCVFCVSSCATSHKTRDVVQTISLDSPTDSRMSAYLGLFKPKKSFLLTDIKTDILVVNVFQTRCPHCQGLTKDLKEIYRLVDKKGLFHKIKFIGVGYGDDFFEVEYFKKHYAIPYPLFADPQAEKVKVKDIPAVFILKMTPAGAQVLYEYYGIMPDAEDLLDIMRSELGSAS